MAVHRAAAEPLYRRVFRSGGCLLFVLILLAAVAAGVYLAREVY